jgi:hypothetical protein
MPSLRRDFDHFPAIIGQIHIDTPVMFCHMEVYWMCEALKECLAFQPPYEIGARGYARWLGKEMISLSPAG